MLLNHSPKPKPKGIREGRHRPELISGSLPCFFHSISRASTMHKIPNYLLLKVIAPLEGVTKGTNGSRGHVHTRIAHRICQCPGCKDQGNVLLRYKEVVSMLLLRYKEVVSMLQVLRHYLELFFRGFLHLYVQVLLNC